MSLRDDLRNRADFLQGHANGLPFPGKTGIIDWPIVDPLIEALLASKEVLKHFPKFEHCVKKGDMPKTL